MSSQLKQKYPNIFKEILKIVSEEIAHINDIDTLLDKVLFEARKITNSDAGTIFLTKGEVLTFKHVQNDTLFKKEDLTRNKYIYSDKTIPINKNSIAGYTALNGKPLMIDDAYLLPEGTPYEFNSNFDKSSQYRSKSILSVPMQTKQGKTLGVIQLINTRNAEGEISSFNKEQRLMVSIFAIEAALAIEKAIMTKTIILRMIKMAELRDPKETGNHVNRVGAYSVEIYHKWATEKGLDQNSIKKFKDNFRLAAMLHDVGKVAISDVILKKPGKLNEQEFNTIKYHTIAGAELFNKPTSKLDLMAKEIALTHHEKWNGQGYPGNFKSTAMNDIQYEEGIKGEKIPISGRIVALADVYDALISQRCYKDAWPEEKVIELIKSESGKQFDPEIVESFFDIYDTISAIRHKYKE